MSNEQEFVAQRLTWDNIRNKADEFRNQYWPEGELPLDIEEILEFELDLNLIIEPSLRDDIDTDAVILSDFKTILVDKQYYSNTKMGNRYRFSIAHEIAHFVLHQDLYKALDLNTFEKWKKAHLNQSSQDYHWFEKQADEFAGRLLVPKDRLVEEYKKEMQKLGDNEIKDREALLAAISDKISDVFGVSAKVIEIRLQKENIFKL